MPVDLSTLTLGQLEALAVVLESAVAVGERAERAAAAQGDDQRFEASIEVDAEFVTVAFGWPCRVSARVVAGEGA